MAVNKCCVFNNPKESINGLKTWKYFILRILLVMIVTLIKCGETVETSTTSPASSTLGNLYRQARSEHYYTSRYGTEGSSVTSGAIGIRSEPEHRDAAYYQSRCITCDPNKSSSADRGWRQRTKYDPYDDNNGTPMRHRDLYDDYNDRGKASGYIYDRPRGPALDYDRTRAPPAYDYDRVRIPAYDFDRYDPYGRNDLSRPVEYPDRDRYNDMRYDRNYDRFAERGNGYDNLNQRHLLYGNRYDPYTPSRRPLDDSYYDHHNRHYPSRYDQYDRYDQYERSYYRRPHDDRYPLRGNDDTRGYHFSGAWAPGYERGYANAWNYAGGMRDNWREPERDRDRDSGYGDNWKDLNRDRDAGPYRPRDYFYDSTIPPGGSRGTSYLYDRPESSTKPDSTEREKPTSSPQTQDNNKGYKD